MLAKDSAISEMLFGRGDREGSLERIRVTTRHPKSPSDLNFCQSNGRLSFFVRKCRLDAKRPLRRTIVYTWYVGMV